MLLATQNVHIQELAISAIGAAGMCTSAVNIMQSLESLVICSSL